MECFSDLPSWRKKMNLCFTHRNTIQYTGGVDWGESLAPTDLHYFQLYFMLIRVAIISTLFGQICAKIQIVSLSPSAHGALTYICSAPPTWPHNVLICESTHKQTLCDNTLKPKSSSSAALHVLDSQVFPLFVIDAVHSGESKHNGSHNIICNHQPTQWNCFKHLVRVSGWGDDQQCD